MSKLTEIDELIGSLTMKELFQDLPDVCEIEDLATYKLTSLGEFVKKLEHIVQRDDKTIVELLDKFK